MLPDRNKQHAKSSYGHTFHSQEQQKTCMNYILQEVQASHIAVWFTSALKLEEKSSPNVDNHLHVFKLSERFDVRHVFLLPFCSTLFFQASHHFMFLSKLQMQFLTSVPKKGCKIIIDTFLYLWLYTSFIHSDT